MSRHTFTKLVNPPKPQCPDCGGFVYSYSSTDERYCPKCKKSFEWALAVGQQSVLENRKGL